jgi:hypothetical protein
MMKDNGELSREIEEEVKTASQSGNVSIHNGNDC